MTSTALILTVNVGSSSVKLAAFERHSDRPPERVSSKHLSLAEASAPALLLRALAGDRSPSMIVHRIVHGGRLREPARLSPDVEAEIERASVWSPVHNPLALRWIRAAREAFGAGAQQRAVFDTGLYVLLSPVARALPLPRSLRCEHGLEKVGFHGLAHASMLRALSSGRRRVVTLQLGAGCSATAFLNGIAVDTSMGPTPLGGLPMATRPGDLDPGAILHLLQVHKMAAADLAEQLEHGSGLQGLAGSGDAQALLLRRDAEALLALEVFCDRVRKQIGAFAAALGGLDAIVFGGGIGEHSPALRSRILSTLEFLGLRLDQAANARATKGRALISGARSLIEVRVAAVDEEALLAEEAMSGLREAAGARINSA